MFRHLRWKIVTEVTQVENCTYISLITVYWIDGVTSTYCY